MGLPTEGETLRLRAMLRHVLWIGGAPDAGKSTVARVLAGKHGLQVYHLDGASRSHFARATQERQPEMWAFAAMSMDERWVLRTPEAMAEHVLRTGPDNTALAIEDLLALPGEPPIAAEGPWFFPAQVAPLLSHPHQAVWLVPTEAFKRASAARRDKPTFRHETSDPERATRNWWERDLLLGEVIRRQAEALGLRFYEVDGSRSVDAMVALLEAHFAGYDSRFLLTQDLRAEG